MIRFVWVRPAGSTAEKLYMVIDPENSMEEIHENNNVGWISLQSTHGTTFIQDQLSAEDNGLQLRQNYPNPFSDISTIHYSTGNDEVITLEIYNMSGVLLRTYQEGFKQAGSYTINIEGSQFDSGIYLYTLRASYQSITGTMSIIH